MGSRKFKFALFGNIYQTKKSANIQNIMSYLSRRDAEVCVEKKFYDFLVGAGKLRPGSVEVLRAVISPPISSYPWAATALCCVQPELWAARISL